MLLSGNSSIFSLVLQKILSRESGEMELILLSQNERKNIKITLNKDVTSFNIISSGSYGLAKEPIVLLQTNLDSSLEIK